MVTTYEILVLQTLTFYFTQHQGQLVQIGVWHFLSVFCSSVITALIYETSFTCTTKKKQTKQIRRSVKVAPESVGLGLALAAGSDRLSGDTWGIPTVPESGRSEDLEKTSSTWRNMKTKQ